MGSETPSRASLLITILGLNLVLTYGIPPELCGDVHLFILKCDPLTVALLCDHERDWHLIGLWLTHCVAVVSSVARTIC